MIVAVSVSQNTERAAPPTFVTRPLTVPPRSPRWPSTKSRVSTPPKPDRPVSPLSTNDHQWFAGLPGSGPWFHHCVAVTPVGSSTVTRASPSGPATTSRFQKPIGKNRAGSVAGSGLATVFTLVEALARLR